MWPKLLPFGPLPAALALFAFLGGALWLAKARIDTLDAELARAATECNLRVADGVADAEKAVREATQAAVEAERVRYEALLADSAAAAQRAEKARQTASEAADGLKAQIQAIYRSNADATVWRDTGLPSAILERLQPASD